jgi:hypothetical protein
VHVARVTIEPNRGNADLGLVHVLLLEADSVQHGLRGTLGLGLGDVAGDLVKGLVLILEAGEGSRESPAMKGRVNG